MRKFVKKAGVVFSCLAVSISAIADESEGYLLEGIEIIGDKQTAKQLPGSGYVVDQDQLKTEAIDDINQALKTVPGLYIREEDGAGLRPNIGIRGATSERSEKITLMEDGVLIAPAPYTAPAAYYFPTILRMQSIEVLKGASMLKYGPQTTGGVLNMISTPIPTSLSGRVSTFFGQNNQMNSHLYFGDGSGPFKFLFEGVSRQTDGFKSIDRSNRDSGFSISDYVIKVGFDTGDAGKLLFKASRTEQTSNETYLGLTDADFNVDPNRRYGLSTIDQMTNKHEGYNLTYTNDIDDSKNISVTMYKNYYQRDWFKLSGGGKIISAVNGGDATQQGILDGTTDSAGLTYKHNNRAYDSEGIQANLNIVADNHNIDIGVRSHKDSMNRFQPQDKYDQVSGAYVYQSTVTPSGSNNRYEQADATTIFIADAWQVNDALLVNAVLRYEDYETSRKQYGTDRTAVASSKNHETDILLPGLSVTYDINENLQTLAGYHKGFSPLGGGADSDEEVEESNNFELGLRYGDDDLFVEGIYFYSDFSDKSELCSVGSPCSNGATAGSYVTGEAEISGLELQVINTFQGDNYSVPFALAYTYTKAEITGDNNASGFQDGDKLPHIPESVFSIRTGIEHASGWDNYAILKHIDSMGATTGYNRTGGSFSETDSLFVVDLISKYELAENTSVYFKVENAFDEQQIVSRAPDGARPNKPRTISTGVVVNF